MREPLEAHQLLHHALDADAMPEYLLSFSFVCLSEAKKCPKGKRV